MLIVLVVIVTYLFFSYAYISVFCFGGEIMSVYIVYVVFRETGGHSGLENAAPG
jgi:hypothetical protein